VIDLAGRLKLAASEEIDDLSPGVLAGPGKLRVSDWVGTTLSVHVVTDDGSWTCFLAPRSWMQEQLAGWIGAKHDDLEDTFGPAVSLPLEEL
jgi:hypothetical protein